MARVLKTLQQTAPVPQRPSPDQVLYAAPNPDGTRKQCQNCVMWISEHQSECCIHAPDVFVPPDAICGYHVFGPPRSVRDETMNGVEFVAPETSGLEQVEGGTACEGCVNYTPTNITGGTCMAVDEADTPGFSANVDARGCCTLWTGKLA